MEIIEIINRSSLDFPIRINTNEIYIELECLFGNYVSYVKLINTLNTQIQITNSEIDKLQSLCTRLLHVYEKYLSGEPGGAYNTFQNIIKDFENEFNIFNIEDKESIYLPIQNLYRLRKVDTTKLERKDIFHVPLHKRKYVNSYRFSIPGLPALYLGTSSYVCWEELLRPSLDDLYISKFIFNPSEKISLLNLSITNQLLISFIKDHSSNILESINETDLIILIKNYLILWPLLASCQIKVQDPDAPFKPEYIIPQLLMQYIGRVKKYDGIIYPSTRVNATYIDPRKCLNIVLPVKKQKVNSNFCLELQKKVLLTEPVSIKFYKTIIHKGMGSSQPTDFEIVKGLKTHYSLTDFGYIERAVEKLELNTVDK